MPAVTAGDAAAAERGEGINLLPLLNGTEDLWTDCEFGRRLLLLLLNAAANGEEEAAAMYDAMCWIGLDYVDNYNY